MYTLDANRANCKLVVKRVGTTTRRLTREPGPADRPSVPHRDLPGIDACLAVLVCLAGDR